MRLTIIVADALSSLPQTVEINPLTATQHSHETLAQNLIQFTDSPLNVIKNQIIISKGKVASYNFEIVFPSYHGHTIVDTEFDSDGLVKMLKSFLNPSVTNAIMTEKQIIGTLQELWSIYFSKFRTKYTRTG